jgi:hypothetical protein
VKVSSVPGAVVVCSAVEAPMSVRSPVLVALALAVASMGCNKNVFFSSAPAKAGWIYVVGADR